MVRISIPTLPPAPLVPPSALTLLAPKQAAAYLARFLDEGKGKTLVITGAGVSVESGIRAYRGKEGTYSNPNYKPILYHELVEDSPRGQMFRKRYWARSFLGYPPVRDSLPNPTHIYIAALQALGLAPNLITQNVDNLHPKARNLVSSSMHTPSSPSSATSTIPPPYPSRILELHGTLAKVHCLKHHHNQPRDDFQAQLAELNPVWDEEAKESERTGRRPRTNPDGDVDLQGVDFTSFVVPPCRICDPSGKDTTAFVKPNVVFFGETIRPEVREESLELVQSASRLLILGTSLATYSAFRLLKLASELEKPMLMISTGPSRADPLPGLEKMDREAGPVLRAYLDELVRTNTGPEVDAVRRVMDMGVVKVPPEVEGPRAEG
ncbi:DHS-like NAD/FAD-binding domain-containing protein [Naematelia encephala]|uniref:DHS-like NAD/FAD-binding domain-containing protein n=1 Tax=Naematelia encephala TaxID=71784 RepID=A0A1Y2B9P8_9TREE|nr:DHS-like NAD/FAD-binding domain-containing protein [Naematelia encephala]